MTTPLTFKEWLSILWQKFYQLWLSRKFYALLISLLTIAQQYAEGKVTSFQALILAVGALSVYAGATALEDGLANRG